MRTVPLFNDNFGKLEMAYGFIQAGRAELADKALREMAADANVANPTGQPGARRDASLASAQVILTANALERIQLDLEKLSRTQIALPIRDSIVKALKCHIADLRELPPF